MRDELINALAWAMAACVYLAMRMAWSTYRAAERLHVVKVERER